MQSIKIQEYSDDYKDQVIDVILNIQTVEFGHINSITLADQPDLLKIPSFYQTRNGNFWVAMDENNTIVGTIALIDIGNQQVALRKMFVNKDYRGKDCGISTQLLNTAIDWCKLKQVEQIFLGTTPFFLAAHKFYAKNNFSEISKSELPPAFPIMGLDTKFYTYIL